MRPSRVGPGFHYSLLAVGVVTYLFVIGSDCAKPGSPRWWNIIKQLRIQPINRTLTITTQGRSLACSRIPGLVPQQLRFCKKYKELMVPIAYGTYVGLEECKRQFKGRRWNCSTIESSSDPKTNRALRRKGLFSGVMEAAFEATWLRHKVVNNKNWRWSGCNDNVGFGVWAAIKFADANERKKTARALMNSHNNRAGRKAVTDNMIIKCKCHGLTGSCEMQTCWRAMKSFKEIGEIIKDKYDGASQMKKEESDGVAHRLIPISDSDTPPKEDDLIYYEKPPNFCDRNEDLGIYGTTGRVCNATSSGIDGCDLLCCDRGFVKLSKTKTVRCRCVFHWCCTVTCDKCAVNYEEHVCL